MYCASKPPAEAATASRPEAQPITPWAPQEVQRVAMTQTWRRLTFLHWRYEPAEVRRLLPAGLELDTFDGAAWVGLIPFEIHNLTGIPRFPETNVRTYVIGPDGSRAVWFFSLEAARLLAVIGARIGYGLPYFWTSMRVTPEAGTVRYRSRRKWPHDSHGMTDIVVRPGELYRPDELDERDHFLTARYRLYTVLRERLASAQIEHPPWPLARASVVELNETLIEAAGLPSPQGAPLAHYAAEIHVKIGYAG
jgi:uncharacterized protein